MILFITALLSCAFVSANHTIMSYEEYSQQEVTFPYWYTLTKPNQRLFYFGANHSCDPSNEQYPVLEQCWQEFLAQTGGENSIVLVEGSKGSIAQDKQSAITTQGGEIGLMFFLAHKEGIKIECAEPDWNLISNRIKSDFSEGEIAYRLFAQYVVQYHRYKKTGKELEFDTYIKKCLSNTRIEYEAIKKLHQKLFGQEFDPNDEYFFYGITNPVRQDTVINKVCRAQSQLRDSAIVDCIEKYIQQGKNIFVVYGCTHAVMQRPAIETIWTKKLDVIKE